MGCRALSKADLPEGLTVLGANAFADCISLPDIKLPSTLKDIGAHAFYNCELLIIDDLGTERTNNFVASEFFSCLNERDIRKRATVITTNLSLEELQAIYSDRTFSRIVSNYKLLKISGPDIRKLKKIARKESEDLQ